LDATPVIPLLVVGLTAGVLGGLLGIGGGLIMIPALELLLGDRYGDESFHLYKLAAIATSVVLSIPATVRHTRARALVYPLLKSLVPLSLVGVFVGVYAAAFFAREQTELLKRVFGATVVLIVLSDNLQRYRLAHGGESVRLACPSPRRRLRIGLLAGFPAGIIAGLLGVGGGVWAVPAQRLGLGVHLRNAVANSSCMIVFIAPLTAVTLSAWIARATALDLAEGWKLAGLLTPGALIGGWCGAELVHRLPVRQLRYAFHVVLFITGMRLLLAGLWS